MNRKLQRVVFSLAVLGWAAALLYFYGSGRIAKYLAPDFRPFCLGGGLGLAVLGAFNLLTAGQRASCGHVHEEGAEHDHEGSDVHPLAAWVLMVVPLAVAVWATKDGFSQEALARKGLYETTPTLNSPFLAANLPPITREEVEKAHRKTASGHLEFNLLELFFATGDRELQAILDGMKVVTQGRVVDEKVRNPNGTRKRLYRLFITCCAADSRAIPVILEFGKTPDEFEDNAWVEAAGTMRFLLEEGQLQPVLEVERVAATEAPYEESFMRKW